MRLDLFRIVLAGAGTLVLWTAVAQAQGSSSHLPSENAVMPPTSASRA